MRRKSYIEILLEESRRSGLTKRQLNRRRGRKGGLASAAKKRRDHDAAE